MKHQPIRFPLYVSMLADSTYIFLLLHISLIVVVLFADIECMLCKYSLSFFSFFLWEWISKKKYKNVFHRNNYLHFFPVCSQKCSLLLLFSAQSFVGSFVLPFVHADVDSCVQLQFGFSIKRYLCNLFGAVVVVIIRWKTSITARWWFSKWFSAYTLQSADLHSAST